MGIKADLMHELIRHVCANATPSEIEEIIADLIAIRDAKFLEIRLGIDLSNAKEQIANKIVQKYSKGNAD